MIVLAALIPAITTTKHAKTIRIFAVGERSSIDILCYIPDWNDNTLQRLINNYKQETSMNFNLATIKIKNVFD